MMNKMMSNDWIAGFVDGEGCFSICIHKRRNYNTHTHKDFDLYLCFKIRLHSDDVHALEEINRMLGVGNVSISSKVAQYAVYNLEDCISISEFFKDKLFTKKRHDFDLWCEVLEIFKAKKHRTTNGFLEIAKIRDMMNVDTSKKHKNYRSIEWFLDYFNESPQKQLLSLKYESRVL